MLSSRRDFLQSAIPAALVGIPLVPMEKEGKHKYKIGDSFAPTNVVWIPETAVLQNDGTRYIITGLIQEEKKQGIFLSYRIKPFGSNYDFVMTEDNLSDGRFFVMK